MRDDCLTPLLLHELLYQQAGTPMPLSCLARSLYGVLACNTVQLGFMDAWVHAIGNIIREVETSMQALEMTIWELEDSMLEKDKQQKGILEREKGKLELELEQSLEVSADSTEPMHLLAVAT